MKKFILNISAIIIFLSISVNSFSQEPKDYSKMTPEEVMEMTYDELLELPFEDLLKLSEIVGVSIEELYEMILNKDIVSASKKTESSFEAPLSTSVVSQEDLKASGVKTIEEALRLVPGFIVREKTNGNFDVHLRGNDNLPSRQMFVYSENSITLVMIDGRPVYNYVHGGTFWESLPVGIEDIDRIEVVRGPSSALYGANAVSGVVNIITKKEQSTKLKTNADIQYGNLSTMAANFGIGKKINKKINFRITGNYQDFNRNSDLLYVYLAGQNGEYISKNQLDTLRVFNPFINQNVYVHDPKDDIDGMYPDPKNSRNVIGTNGYFGFYPGKNLNFDFSAGYQSSEVLSTTMGDTPTPYTGRISKTQYVNLQSKIYDLKAQVNFMNGMQDIVRQDTGFKVDIMNFNSILEYDLNFNNLNIRPGLSFLAGSYNDLPYLNQKGEGFLNGKKELFTTAGSLRADYKPLENLRFIAALRAEKYNTHNDLYYSYQLIGSYILDKKHNFRVVYSKANRGPFMVDSYADYLWVRQSAVPGTIKFSGAALDLLTMNMFEFGYRVKPVKNIQADIEIFKTKTKNYAALYPDSVSVITSGLNAAGVNPALPFASMRYRNLDLTSDQTGVTANIDWVINKNLILKVFGTYQVTKAYDAISIDMDSTVADMLTKAFVNYNMDPNIIFSKNFTEERIDEDHEWTPSFYGGLTVDYKLFKEKARIFTSSYFYGEQTFENKNGIYEIDPKIILNVKLSYKVYKESTVYINVRNILGDEREFPYMDEIGANILAGLNFNF